MADSRPGWLTLDEALAIIAVIEHDKPEPEPELIFAFEQSRHLVRQRAEQAVRRLAKLLSSEADDED